MAPRLNPEVAMQLNSFGWPVWLLCTSITVAVFSLISLFAYSRIQAAQDQRRRRQQLLHLQQAEVDVQWSFPEKEDKAARFRRWAEVLRFKPREARLPIPTEGQVRLDVKVALEVFYREAQAAGLAAAPELPRSPKHEAVRIREDESSEALRERVRERILQFLIECGPPKGLCVITEEDRSLSATPSVPSTPSAAGSAARQHSVDMRKLLDSAILDSSAPSTPRAASVGSRPLASPKPPPALALDGEAVLRTETGETVTRELLWAVLARIHAEAHAAASAAISSPASTPSAAAACPASAAAPFATPTPSATTPLSSSSLTQPLLGEWENPLQRPS